MSEVDLFRIVMGDDVWTVTSADERQVYNDEVYTPLAMGRTNVEQKNSLARANLDVRIPLGHELAQRQMTSISEVPVSLTLFVDDGTDVAVQWKGLLASIKPDDAALTLTFESIFTSLKRPGLRARYQRSCRHAVYYGRCGLDRADFAVAATLSAISGDTMTVPAASGQTDGYYMGGMIEAADGTLAFITGHAGTTITVQRVPYAFALQFANEGAGSAVTLYPGCDRSRETCKSRFNNLVNYGGFDFIPKKNPMGGGAIV